MEALSGGGWLFECETERLEDRILKSGKLRRKPCEGRLCDWLLDGLRHHPGEATHVRVGPAFALSLLGSALLLLAKHAKAAQPGLLRFSCAAEARCVQGPHACVEVVLHF